MLFSFEIRYNVVINYYSWIYLARHDWSLIGVLFTVSEGTSLGCRNAQDGFLIRSATSPRKFTGRKFILPVNSVRNWLFRPVDTLTLSFVSRLLWISTRIMPVVPTINDLSSTLLIHPFDPARVLKLHRWTETPCDVQGNIDIK